MIDVTDYPQKELKGVRSWPILERVWSSGLRKAGKWIRHSVRGRSSEACFHFGGSESRKHRKALNHIVF